MARTLRTETLETVLYIYVHDTLVQHGCSADQKKEPPPPDPYVDASPTRECWLSQSLFSSNRYPFSTPPLPPDHLSSLPPLIPDTLPALRGEERIQDHALSARREALSSIRSEESTGNEDENLEWSTESTNAYVVITRKRLAAGGLDNAEYCIRNGWLHFRVIVNINSWSAEPCLLVAHACHGA